MNNQSTFALFHSKTLNTAVRNFSFPPDIESRHEKIVKWIEALNTGTLDKVKEVSLHGDFLKDIFQEVLGYRSVIQGGGKVWEIHAEQTISDGGGSADAALGFFTALENKKGKVKLQGRVVAPIELKGTKEDLDRPAPGRKESAIDQGWRYANYTPECKWIIVSNYREVRLYQTSKTPAYYEQFLLTDLADLEAFKRFYFLLCRQNFLPKQDTPQAVSIIDRLLSASTEAQEEITKQLYEEYKAVRLNLVKHFRFIGSPDIPHRDQVLIEKAQKTLDRVLFIAFCEDRGLLPQKTFSNAHDRKDPYHPRPIWDNYKAVFRWVGRGNDDPPIPGYNGGLFQHDPLLDEQLTVPDPLCTQLNRLTRFDFDTEVSVDILGHIFEQSISDLEELKSEVTKQEYDKKKSKRKTQGVFYTPAFITQYIVEIAIGGYLQQQKQKLRQRFQVGQPSDEQRETEIEFWKAYRDRVLKQTRVLDPACGSGAFLIAAFDYFMRQYEQVNQTLLALQHTPSQNPELDRTILSNNLFGVDISPESVEITKLSLWLKTAEQGKTLTYLDNNIKVGNSIVDDPHLTDFPFNWQAEFHDIFAAGGFDVVIGNPPYVRQELLSAIKPYLQSHYDSYHGVADIYTYFYEKGLKILKPAGMLSYIVTNKWLRSGYGEPLRNFFSQQGVFEQIIDFGHAPIFEDADTFPCIVVVRKPNLDDSKHLASSTEDTRSQAESGNGGLEGSESVLVCPVLREELNNINLTQYIKQNGYTIPWSRFNANAWSLEPPAVDDLMRKIKQAGIPLKDFAGVKPLYGIKTGFNDAFLIDEATKNKLIQADPKSAEIIKPYLRGQDIRRWMPEWANIWIILLKSSANYNWSWSNASSCESAEQIFAQRYPSIYEYIKFQENRLRARSDKGVNWWELRSCVYYEAFETPKIIWKDLSTYSEFCFDDSGIFTNDLCFILTSSDKWLLAVLNSPLMWYYLHRVTIHAINETLRLKNIYTETLPIAPPTDEIRAEVEPIVSHLIEITKANQVAYRDVLDWLQIEYKIAKIGQKLENFANLEFPEFADEIRKRMPKSKSSDPLSPAAFKALRQAYNEYVPAIQIRKIEATKLEYRLSDIVNCAYKLTPEEIDLIWKTAPPRMPITRL